MFLFIPTGVDVPTFRHPIANLLIIGAICLVSVTAWLDRKAQNPGTQFQTYAFLFDASLSEGEKSARLKELLTNPRDERVARIVLEARIRQSYSGLSDAQIFSALETHEPTLYERLVLRDWSIAGLLGCAFLHADPLHLIGNMLFLWLFGNAVCAKVGNLIYPALFFGLALLSGAAHLLADGHPAVGASGAINGVVGLYLVLYPLNNINMFYFYWCLFVRSGTLALSSFWIILMWLGFDLWGALTGSEGVAYAAHIGGLAAGVLTMTALWWTGLVTTDGHYERSLFDLAGFGGGTPRRPSVRPDAPVAIAQQPRRPPTTPAAIEVYCLCGKQLRVPEGAAGKTGRCPDCGQVVVIPAPYRAPSEPPPPRTRATARPKAQTVTSGRAR